ncbi:MAG: Uma2 family endonuclease [Rhodobacteraceae bacterium]|nr:Uma2 family endonuclease [Paracoccaceae bacterium]MYF46390.1 Uma2 family endonuclease [Paracoccaceae bacterium]MYI90590.1 Uma2 family endonuclease [Paracoccaceae bacterium]
MTTSIDKHHVKGKLGSDFWRIRVPPDLVPKMALEIDWNRMGRRVMIDAKEGIIAWMSPSSLHADLSSASDKIVQLAGATLKTIVKDKRDNRWGSPGDPKNVGLEADAAFYVGDNAVGWYTARRKGQEEKEAYEARTPPDLVVEVEVTHFDEDKPQRYAELGVREMWRVDGKKGSGQLQIEILDLQASSDGPKPVEESRILPGLPLFVLPEAYELADMGQLQRLSVLLRDNLAQANTPEPDSSPLSFGSGI